MVALLGTAESALAQDHVREGRRSPAEIVLRDTLTGGVLGSGVAGGIIFYWMGVKNDDSYDWQRTLAWGAAIGLGAGLLFGIIDAATAQTRLVTATKRTKLTDLDNEATRPTKSNGDGICLRSFLLDPLRRFSRSAGVVPFVGAPDRLRRLFPCASPTL